MKKSGGCVSGAEQLYVSIPEVVLVVVKRNNFSKHPVNRLYYPSMNEISL
jgi:hypothetical protein